MAHKSMGLWLGAAVLAGTACAHSSEASRQPNMTSNQPVAQDDNAPRTNADTLSPPPGGVSSRDRTDPYSGTTGAPDTGSSTGTMNPSDLAGTTGETGSSGSWNSQSGMQEKGAILSRADGSQPGVVQDYSEGTLTLTSRSQGTRQTPRVQTMTVSPSVPIFSGDTRVSADALVPGADVRVYYKADQADDQKEVIGVDVLKQNMYREDDSQPPATESNE